MEHLYTTTVAAPLAGMTRVTLVNQIHSGLVNGISLGHGNKANLAISEYELFVLIVARQLKQHGFKLAAVKHAMNWLRSQTLAALQQQWEAGRNLLFAVGDFEPFPCLLNFEQVYRNPAIDLPAANAAGVPVLVINTEEAYRHRSSHRTECKRGKTARRGRLTAQRQTANVDCFLAEIAWFRLPHTSRRR